MRIKNRQPQTTKPTSGFAYNGMLRWSLVPEERWVSHLCKSPWQLTLEPLFWSKTTQCRVQKWSVSLFWFWFTNLSVCPSVRHVIRFKECKTNILNNLSKNGTDFVWMEMSGLIFNMQHTRAIQLEALVKVGLLKDMFAPSAFFTKPLENIFKLVSNQTETNYLNYYFKHEIN